MKPTRDPIIAGMITLIAWLLDELDTVSAAGLDDADDDWRDVGSKSGAVTVLTGAIVVKSVNFTYIAVDEQPDTY